MSPEHNQNLTFSVTHGQVLGIAIPMTLGFMTTPLLGLTDTAVVGHLKQAELLAGLAIGSILIDLIFSTFNFLRASTTGLTAQAYGRHDMREQQAVFWRALCSALACGMVSILVLPLLVWLGLLLMGPQGQVAQAARTYFSIRLLSSPLAFANFAILGFVLGRGQGKTGLLLQSIINGINIVMSISLGIGLGWGVAGVAWGTLMGEAAGMVTGLWIVLRLFRHQPPLRLADIVVKSRLLALFTLNRDILIRTFVLMAAFTIMTRIGNSFGPVTLAANAVLMNIFLLSGYYLDGLANAAEQITGRAIGANHRPAFERGLRLTMGWSFALAVFSMLFFLLFGPWIISLLTKATDVQETALTYLVWAAITGPTGVLAFLMDGVFIGATWSRDMRNQMLISFGAYLLALAVLVPAFGNHGLWLSLNIFLLFRGFFLLALVKPRADQTFRAAQSSMP